MAASTIIDISDANFEQEVLRSSEPVLVDFWAPWCGPCGQLAPIFEDAAASFSDRAKFAKLNTDDNKDLMERYGVRGIPTILLFKDGQIVDRIIGFTQKRVIDEMLQPAKNKTLLPVINDENVERLEEQSKPSLILCGNPQNGQFRSLMNSLEKLAPTLRDRVNLFRADSEHSQELAKRFNINQFGLILVKDGEVIDRTSTLFPKDWSLVDEEAIRAMVSATGKPESVPTPKKQIEIEREIAESKTPILLDIWAAWLGSRRRAFEIVQDRFPGRIAYVKVVGENYPAVAERYLGHARATALVLLKGGRVVSRFDSVSVSEEELILELKIWENEPEDNGIMHALDPEEFQEQVVQGQTPALIYVGPPTLASFSRIVRFAAARFDGKLKFFSLDTTRYPDAAKAFVEELPEDVAEKNTLPRIRPVLVLFKAGAVAARLPTSRISREDAAVLALAKHFTE